MGTEFVLIQASDHKDVLVQEHDHKDVLVQERDHTDDLVQERDMFCRNVLLQDSVLLGCLHARE